MSSLSSGSDTWEQGSDNVNESTDVDSISGYEESGIQGIELGHIFRKDRGNVTPGQMRTGWCEGGYEGWVGRWDATPKWALKHREGDSLILDSVSLRNSMSLERTISDSDISLGAILSTDSCVWLRVTRLSWCCLARALSRWICASYGVPLVFSMFSGISRNGLAMVSSKTYPHPNPAIFPRKSGTDWKSHYLKCGQ